MTSVCEIDLFVLNYENSRRDLCICISMSVGIPPRFHTDVFIHICWKYVTLTIGIHLTVLHYSYSELFDAVTRNRE